MPKAKAKKNEDLRDTIGNVEGFSNIAKNFERYRKEHWSLTQQILALEAKIKEKKDKRKILEKEMKEASAREQSLWEQIEFAF